MKDYPLMNDKSSYLPLEAFCSVLAFVPMQLTYRAIGTNHGNNEDHSSNIHLLRHPHPILYYIGDTIIQVNLNLVLQQQKQEAAQMQAQAMQVEAETRQQEAAVKAMGAQAKAERDIAEANKTNIETALTSRNAAFQEMMARQGL